MNMPEPMGGVFCTSCGAHIDRNSDYCPLCGQQQRGIAPPRSRTAYVLLAVLVGMLGIHNFYAGYTKKAVVQLVLCLLGLLTAIILIGGFILLALIIWSWIEACTVDRDAWGNPLG